MGFNRSKVDLHIHSTASDGSLTPGEIVKQAASLNLYAISITDHDSIDAYETVRPNKLSEGLFLISGVEISTAFPPPFFSEKESLHLLGYGFDINNTKLRRMLLDQQKARSSRNPKIIEKLNQAGIPISIEDVEKMAGKKDIGRPHIAKYLVSKGFARDIDEAFDRYLGKGRCAYVEKTKIPVQEAIDTIKVAGGIAVMAHPILIQRHTDLPLETLVRVLVNSGIEGMEVYYPGQSSEETRFFESLAERFGLIMTGGSDFHGDINPEIQMGSGYKGDLNLSPKIFDDLKAAISSKKENRPEKGVAAIESALNYKFSNHHLIETALCHRSYANEHEGIENNERLEFLGDAVLSVVISHMLMNRFPDLNEGKLSKIRSSLVNKQKLASIATGLCLGDFIRLGKGETKTDGKHKASILADTMEAVIAAIYLDGGFNAAFEFLKSHFSSLIDSIAASRPVFDHKSRVQEIVQNQGFNAPDYRVIRESGPDHDKTFEVCLTTAGICTKGTGKSKKAAEQDAAKKALKILMPFSANHKPKSNT